MLTIKNQLRENIRKVTGYGDKLLELQKIVTDSKTEKPDTHINYISGKITADGKEHIRENLVKMGEYTQKIENLSGQFSFSAEDLFEVEYWIQGVTPDLEQTDTEFWTGVLKSGITDIYMSPGWEKSKGAGNELKFAKDHGITIHYDLK